MSEFIVYLSSTGEIMRTGSCPDLDVMLQPKEGESVILGQANDTLQYIDLIGMPSVVNKQLVPFLTPVNFIADGVDECVISGLPDPCTVTWPDREVTEVVGGSIQYSVDYAGTYTFTLGSPIHLDTEVSVEALAVS